MEKTNVKPAKKYPILATRPDDETMLKFEEFKSRYNLNTSKAVLALLRKGLGIKPAGIFAILFCTGYWSAAIVCELLF